MWYVVAYYVTPLHYQTGSKPVTHPISPKMTAETLCVFLTNFGLYDSLFKNQKKWVDLDWFRTGE
jgi:hypothetical protein